MIRLSERNIVILATVFALSFIAILFFLKFERQNPSLISCTLEARICPDGSAVGRTGPKCEFSPCPEVSPTPISEWKTYTSDQFSFSFDYPSRFQPALPQGENGPYYYTLSNLGSKYGENITVGAIANNPEYKMVPPETVAKKEMATSGYKYTVTKLKVNSYSAAITTFEGTDVSTNTLTVAYPKNNLFVYLILPRDLSKVDFEKILSTFKFTDSNNEVSSWKNYIFDNYPLSLRYPSDWTQNKWEFSSANSIIDLTVYGDDALTISDFLVKQDEMAAKGWEGSYSIKVNSTKKTMIAGLSSIQRQETVLAAGFETYSTYFKFNHNFYRLSIRPKNSSDLNLDDVSIYQQILSTFKFTNNQKDSFCGGITGKMCPVGSYCKLDGNYPDAGGTCVYRPD